MPRKINRAPLIRESSDDKIINISIFRQGLKTPRKTIRLYRFGMAYVITTTKGNSRIPDIIGCEPLPQALTRAYSLAFQTSREIAGQEEFPISFEGKSGMHALTDSQKFDEFFLSYIRQAYDLTH